MCESALFWSFVLILIESATHPVQLPKNSLCLSTELRLPAVVVASAAVVVVSPATVVVIERAVVVDMLEVRAQPETNEKEIKRIDQRSI